MRLISSVGIVVALSLFDLVLLAGDLQAPPEKIPNDPRELVIFNQLHDLKLTNTRWANIDVEDALKDLTARSRTVDPNHAGIKFALQIDQSKPIKSVTGYQIQRKIQNIILLDETSIADIAGYICAQTNLTYRITRDGVIFSQ